MFEHDYKKGELISDEEIMQIAPPATIVKFSDIGSEEQYSFSKTDLILFAQQCAELGAINIQREMYEAGEA